MITPASDSSNPADRAQRIILADDHPLIREGLAALVGLSCEFEIVGQAGTCAEARRLIECLRPKLAVLDLFLHGQGGVSLIEQLARMFPDVRLLVLAEQEESLYAPACLRAGAAGYVMKNRPAGQVLQALRQVAAGGCYTSPELQLILQETQAFTSGASPVAAAVPLSSRELDILHLLGNRLTTREIAGRLALSAKTVESYYDRMKLKLGCPTMRELHHHAQEIARATPS